MPERQVLTGNKPSSVFDAPRTAAAGIWRRHLPKHADPSPLPVLWHLVDHSATDVLTDQDVLDALVTIVELRHLLTFLEARYLQRARHWGAQHGSARHGSAWITQAEIGEILGISVSGVTRCRQRRIAAVARRSRTKVSPQLPWISRSAAGQHAQDILDRRGQHQDEVQWLPDASNVLGVAWYVLIHEDDVPETVFAQDLLDGLRILVSARRQLDELEHTYLGWGRRIGMSNLALGEPFGRHDRGLSTWRARRRLANAVEHRGRRHVLTNAELAAHDVSEPGVSEPSGVDQRESSEEPAIREVARRLCEFQDQLGADTDVDEWIRWLRDDVVKCPDDEPLTRAGIGLLWTVMDVVRTALDTGMGDPQKPSPLVAHLQETGVLADVQAVVSDVEQLHQAVKSRAREQADVPTSNGDE